MSNSSSFKNEERLARLYKSHYHGLLDFAFSVLRSEKAAEDVVQDLFVQLLVSNSQATYTKSYLYTSVRNRAYDVIKRQKVRQEWANERSKEGTEDDKFDQSVEHAIQEKELQERIDQVLLDMPARRREIFLLSRYHGFTYKEIADVLNVSVNVVDKQMGKALSAFRARLQNYLPTLLLVLMSIFIFL